MCYIIIGDIMNITCQRCGEEYDIKDRCCLKCGALNPYNKKNYEILGYDESNAPTPIINGEEVLDFDSEQPSVQNNNQIIIKNKPSVSIIIFWVVNIVRFLIINVLILLFANHEYKGIYGVWTSLDMVLFYSLCFQKLFIKANLPWWGIFNI